ncbi:MAG: hypothetical protein K2W95_23730 [Candidatus Obscuribacterales bacterium]|nr:hypothetical protein [Candidatus Obscuribacterales bacterium]
MANFENGNDASRNRFTPQETESETLANLLLAEVNTGPGSFVNGVLKLHSDSMRNPAPNVLPPMTLTDMLNQPKADGHPAPREGTPGPDSLVSSVLKLPSDSLQNSAALNVPLPMTLTDMLNRPKQVPPIPSDLRPIPVENGVHRQEQSEEPRSQHPDQPMTLPVNQLPVRFDQPKPVSVIPKDEEIRTRVPNNSAPEDRIGISEQPRALSGEDLRPASEKPPENVRINIKKTQK